MSALIFEILADAVAEGRERKRRQAKRLEHLLQFGIRGPGHRSRHCWILYERAAENHRKASAKARILFKHLTPK